MSFPRTRDVASTLPHLSFVVFLSCLILLSGGLATVRGQSALDGFDPNANGTIRAVAVQSDGKILIGGDFTSLAPNGGAPVSRNHIARLNPDGTLDTAFNPDAGNTVRAIVVQPDGKILVGGDFGVFIGLPRILRNHIARLDATTGRPDSFNPNMDNIVRAIALQADGRVIAGGDFTTLAPNGGAVVTRPHIARVNSDGTLDSAFRPNVNDQVFAIALQTNGKILLGGAFTNVNGLPRNHIARLDPATSQPDSFNPNANGAIQAVVVQPDGKILIGGDFTTLLPPNTGLPVFRRHIARLDPTTGVADAFHPDANAQVLTIAVQADGSILAGGAFTGIGGQSRPHIGRVDATNGAADSFRPIVNGTVVSIAVQSDGKNLAGGTFTSVSGQTRNNIARLEIDGRLDRTLNLGAFTGSVAAIAVQTDGKILVGGSFSSVLGVPRNNIARLNTDGTLDTAFNPDADNIVLSFALQSDGQVLVGGAFTHVSGLARNRMARLDATTGLADSFNPNVTGVINVQVAAIAVQADGKILAAGNFENVGGVARNNIARLDPTTGLADPFNPNVTGLNNGFIDSMAVQVDGRILIGGGFTSIGGQSRANIGRLNPDGTLDTAFHPEANDSVFAIAVQADGKILAGGPFTHIGGATRFRMARLISTSGIADSLFDPSMNFGFVDSIAVQADGKIFAAGFFTMLSPNGGAAVSRTGIARLNPNGTLDTAFDAHVIGPSNVNIPAIALQADGKILVGGTFTSIGGQDRNVFARLTNDTAALQSLTVTPTAVTLARGGSSPQFTRVTFEISPNNVTFAFLGNGTPVGSSWTLTGLSLPTGHTLFIRARGFYRSGGLNGSESVTGTRRNAFFPGSFVIGDRSAVVGQRVVFWGAQWAKWNSLSGGPAPASFKGFASSISTNPPACGGTWTSDPGNSAARPGGVPANIDVIVARSITQSGAVIAGDISQMAVVQPDPGYDSNPGHMGTGTVVSVSCDDQ